MRSIKDLMNIRRRALSVRCPQLREDALLNIEHAMLARRKGWHTTSRVFVIMATAAITAGGLS